MPPIIDTAWLYAWKGVIKTQLHPNSFEQVLTEHDYHCVAQAWLNVRKLLHTSTLK